MWSLHLHTISFQILTLSNNIWPFHETSRFLSCEKDFTIHSVLTDCVHLRFTFSLPWQMKIDEVSGYEPLLPIELCFVPVSSGLQNLTQVRHDHINVKKRHRIPFLILLVWRYKMCRSLDPTGDSLIWFVEPVSFLFIHSLIIERIQTETARKNKYCLNRRRKQRDRLYFQSHGWFFSCFQQSCRGHIGNKWTLMRFQFF